MKITNIQAVSLKYNYKEPIADGCTPCSARGSVIVIVETDSELFGIGEAATFGADVRVMKTIIELQLKPLLIGENPLNIEMLWNKMVWRNWSSGRRGMIMGGISGIDIALWDLLGKVAKMPLYQLLGANTQSVLGYASAGFYAKDKTLEDLKREMESYAKSGFTAFKMKIGCVNDILCSPHRYMNGESHKLKMEQDICRIECVREAIAKEDLLMLDMNGTWNVGDVLKNQSVFEENNIYFIEEPIRSDNITGYCELTSKLEKTMVAGIESEQGLSRYRELLDLGAIDIVQANIGWAGGITGGKQIASLALAHNKLFVPHTFFSAVLNTVNVHMAASYSNVPFVECELNENPLRTEMLKNPLEVDDNANIWLNDKPGLGIEIDWDKMNQYII
ncbi:MAG: mandelate racemase/muconate lactonizing enzyme family protein [Eubacteriales bacterium]